MTTAQLSSTELCAALPSNVLITAVDSLGAELLDTSSDCFYFDTLSLAFDVVVAELTARGLWLGEDS